LFIYKVRHFSIFSPITYNLVANKDFAGRPIVPGNLQGLSPKYQYDDSTSIISKSIGGALNISPKQIDYLIKSYSGIIGQLGLPLAGGSSSKNPVEAAFIADKSYSNKASTEFYNNKNKYTTKYNDMKFKGENDPKTKAIKAYYDRAASQISNFNKARKDLEKRGEGSDKIKEYREQMNLIAESANNFKKSIESNGNIFTDIYGISSNADEANKVFSKQNFQQTLLRLCLHHLKYLKTVTKLSIT
jgi:hypothetical protein